MDEQAVREHAQAHAAALLSGDIGKAAEEMSWELQHNLGPIVAMLPMPLTEASIESIESTPTGYRVVLHLVGEGDSLRLATRWKDRDGESSEAYCAMQIWPDESARTHPVTEGQITGLLRSESTRSVSEVAARRGGRFHYRLTWRIADRRA
jgi:hypothetical protein